MTAVLEQSTRITRQRRIIERPRLINRLEAADAGTILLVAPAGYGKTTLARQWGRTLSRVIWVSATPSHRDVVTFSEDVAQGVDQLGGDASKFIDEYMRARPNPQRAPREIANVLAARVEEAKVQWLVLDDYHDLVESPEVEEMVAILRERLSARFLVASRVRPEWATTRGVIHGAVVEIGADELALTPEETTQVIGRRPDLEPLIEHAKGWPAVVTLAAGLEAVTDGEDLIPTMLHRYVAEELFKSASSEVRDGLIALALMPDLSAARIAARFGDDADAFLHRVRDLGFVGGDEVLELHPLLREFLLVKLAENPSAEERVRMAVDEALEAEAWNLALALVMRFDLEDLVDPVLQKAFKPLVRSGRLGTLAAFASRARKRERFAPVVDVVETEVALRDGKFELAADIGARALTKLADQHELRSRAHSAVGRSRFFLSDFEGADAAFAAGRDSAQDALDETEAVFGLATTQMLGEKGDASDSMKFLADSRNASPDQLLRYWSARLAWQRFHEGLREISIDTPMQAFPQASDPRARTSFVYSAAHVFCLRGDYTRASKYLQLFSNDTETFDLAFALPYVHWTAASIGIGLRRFGDAERRLQLVEELVDEDNNSFHGLNVRMLRARMLLQIGRQDEALDLVSAEPRAKAFPSWVAEFYATRALVRALVGDSQGARLMIAKARAGTQCLEVHVLAKAAETAAASKKERSAAVRSLFEQADQVAIWDPVVCVLRALPELIQVAATTEAVRPLLSALIERTGDVHLARVSGMRVRSRRQPADLLSQRESEVLGLMARGLRNREIATALFIAESTVKVHVRHILERLGVRTRAEAVARHERLVSGR